VADPPKLNAPSVRRATGLVGGTTLPNFGSEMSGQISADAFRKVVPSTAYLFDEDVPSTFDSRAMAQKLQDNKVITWSYREAKIV